MRNASKPSALGCAALVSFQQDQIRGQFHRESDGFGLTGIEGSREQPRRLVLSKFARFDPAVLEGLSDLLQR